MSEQARVYRGAKPTGVLFLDADRFRDVKDGTGTRPATRCSWPCTTGWARGFVRLTASTAGAARSSS